MAYKFLSPEWAEQVTLTLREHPDMAAAIDSPLLVQFQIDDVPEGRVSRYYFGLSTGAPTLQLGTVDDPDLTLTIDYETASALSQGTLDIQAAFFKGRLTISGNVAKLLKHQRTLGELAKSLAELDMEY